MANALENLKDLKPWQKVTVAAAGGGIVLYVYLQHKKSAAAASGSSATVTDPVTGQTYPATGVDPVDGLSYGQEISQYGSVSAAESAFSQAQQSSAYGLQYGTDTAGVGSFNSPTPLVLPSGTQTGTNYVNNGQWAQAVEGGLTDIGYAPTDVAASLGRYLGGLSLTPDQANIIQAALAEYGNPPAGSFQIIHAPVSTPVTTGGTPTGTPVISGGHVVVVNGNDATVAWKSNGIATQFRVKLTGPGKLNGFTNTVSVPQASYSGLEAGHHYSVSVQPLVSGQSKGKAGTIDFNTIPPKKPAPAKK